ncbi:hypothetical protein QAD02_020921 [Eretmocerus hayati]|uniref:Uncharacterized protein n=1 Tax=Eretmocerus hayati TaxID=131215 RepID=A0ACC2PPS3_9HYME|nr:hypothetical protein QAD02_020921 [Eretmocerus hayati]
MAVNRNAKELRRIKFKPGKLKDSTSGSDGLANETQERCEKLVKVKQEMYEAQLAAKRQQTQKQIDIWKQRSTTNVPDSHDSDSKRSETFTNTNGNEPNNDTSDDGTSPIQPGDLDLSNSETENRDRGEDQSFSPQNTISNGPNDYWKQTQQEIKVYEFDPAVSVGQKRPVKRKAALIVNALSMYRDKSRPEYAEAKKRYKISSGQVLFGQGAKANPVPISVLKCEQQPEKFFISIPKRSWETFRTSPNKWGKNTGFQGDHQYISIYYDYLLKRFNDEEDHERVHYMKKATNDIGRWMRGERLKMQATAISDAEKEAEQIRPLN